MRFPSLARTNGASVELLHYTGNVSLSLEVAVRRKCSADRIEAFLNRKGCEVAGGAPVDASGGSFEIARKTAKGPAHLCIVDGPLRVETENLADKLAAMLLAPKWLYQLNLSAGTPLRHSNTALGLAKLIAKEGDGAVYDPQKDEVLWPRSRPKRFVKRRDAETGPTLFLDAFIPARANGSFLMRSYLETCRRFLPEALPKRYGDYEPMQHRLRGAGDEKALLDFAQKLSEIEYGGSFFWSASRPFEHSSVSFGDRRRGVTRGDLYDVPGRERMRPMTVLGAWVLLGCGNDDAFADALETFLVEVARATGAFYACASLGTFSYHGPMWIGIPETTTWLSWYGNEYAVGLGKDRLRPGVTVYPEGLMVRRAATPGDSEETLRHPVRTPDQLIGVYLSEPKRIAAEIPKSIPEGDIEQWSYGGSSDGG